MCIYYSDRNDLTYGEQEHIFPVGLGGIGMLPRGYVSDQANALFSPLELKLMHNSLLMIPRTIFGPGKRGSFDPSKASKSEISTMRDESGKITLGYMALGKSYYINSLSKCGVQAIYTVGTAQHHEPDQSWSDFERACAKFDLGRKFVSVRTKELAPLDWVFGFYASKYYLALGVFSALILKFQGAKLFLATTARKFPDSAFQSLRGIRMPPRPQECRKPPYNAKPGPSQIWAVSRTESGIY